MIRKLLTTTAVATLAIGGGQIAIAQTTDRSAPAVEYMETASEQSRLASELLGQEVFAGEGNDAESIGEINDLIVAQDGSIESVVIGVGGFLGAGEKDVAISFESLSWSQPQDGEARLIVAVTKEELDSAPSFDRAALQQDGEMSRQDSTAMAPQSDREPPAGTDRMAAGEQPAGQPAAPDGQQMAQQGEAADRQAGGADTQDFAGMQPAPAEAITAENLLGTTVYGSGDENVGEVADVVLTENGEIDAVILDVGGFLGIGEKPVAIGFDALEILADERGDLVVRTKFTQEQLEAAQEYVEEDFKSNRDTMLLR